MFSYHKIGKYFYNPEWQLISAKKYFAELNKFIKIILDKANQKDYNSFNK